jgi:uncharacterized coiled-coil protein SlyX
MSTNSFTPQPIATCNHVPVLDQQNKCIRELTESVRDLQLKLEIAMGRNKTLTEKLENFEKLHLQYAVDNARQAARTDVLSAGLIDARERELALHHEKKNWDAMVAEQIQRIDEMIQGNRAVMEKLKEENACLNCKAGMHIRSDTKHLLMGNHP